MIGSFDIAPLMGFLSTNSAGVTSKQLFAYLKRNITAITTIDDFRAYLTRADLLLQAFNLALKYIPTDDRWLLISRVPNHPELKPLDENVIGAAILVYLSQNQKPFEIKKLVDLLSNYTPSNVERTINELIEADYLTKEENKLTLGHRLLVEIDIKEVLAHTRQYFVNSSTDFQQQ